jgi:hypothetical protein
MPTVLSKPPFIAAVIRRVGSSSRTRCFIARIIAAASGVS